MHYHFNSLEFIHFKDFLSKELGARFRKLIKKKRRRVASMGITKWWIRSNFLPFLSLPLSCFLIILFCSKFRLELWHLDKDNSLTHHSPHILSNVRIQRLDARSKDTKNTAFTWRGRSHRDRCKTMYRTLKNSKYLCFCLFLF